MKVYVIEYRSHQDYEEQGIASIFKTYNGAVKYIIEKLNGVHICDDRYENENWEFIVTEKRWKND